MKFLREFDEKGHELAELQSRLFSLSTKEKIPSYFFIKVFCYYSDVDVLDDLSFYYKNISEEDIYTRVKTKITINHGKIYGEGEMAWIGYFYRAFSYITGMKTYVIFEKVQPSYLRKVYYPYHTQDIVKAIKLVIKDLHISTESDDSKIMGILRKYA